MTRLEALRGAIGFLTPLGGPMPPSGDSMTYFPLVGAAIGACVGATQKGLQARLGARAASSIAIAVETALTGGLHLDGLVDSADGLFAHAPTASRRSIMAEPTIGTFGATALGVALIGRFNGLADARLGPSLGAAIWCASRSLMVLGSRLLPYAKPDGGLATAFAKQTSGLDEPLIAAVSGVVGATAFVVGIRGARGGAALILGLAAGGAVLELSRRRLDGFTGDTLGAAGVALETVSLLALSRP